MTFCVCVGCGCVCVCVFVLDVVTPTSTLVYVGCGPLINVETLPEYSAGWEEDTFSSFLG